MFTQHKRQCNSEQPWQNLLIMNFRDVKKAGSLKAKVKALKAKARSLKAKTKAKARDQG